MGKAGTGKAITGIEGLDEITGGGLPRGRVTLVLGGPGSGKTVLALQSLVTGALNREPGIFVAFEERSAQIIANAASFGWGLPALQRDKLFFLDAKPSPELYRAGPFDLTGMLAALADKVRAMKAQRIVFDSLDMVLALLPDPDAQRQETMRVHEWLSEQGLSAIVTAKARNGEPDDVDGQPASYLQYLVDCCLALSHGTYHGVSHRSLRVLKYRGSAFMENEAPLLIGPSGIEVAGGASRAAEAIEVSNERLSSGIERLDTMLGGGHYRGASVLVTGAPGTAKSTLAGAFAEAMCARKERVLYVSFDSSPAEIVRNLRSVNVNLQEGLTQGRLRLCFAHGGESSAEAHYLRIRTFAREHRARCVIIDPLSALSKQGNELAASGVVERLIHWGKAAGITVLCTSLLDTTAPEIESTPLDISTIADTWIHLSYLVHGGERNRALTIVKSRGTSHSNQVRELVLSSQGITLMDVYSAGGEVVMGSLRWEREQREREERERKQAVVTNKLVQLDLAEVELSARLEATKRELSNMRAQRQGLIAAGKHDQVGEEERQAARRKLRGADAVRGSRRKVPS